MPFRRIWLFAVPLCLMATISQGATYTGPPILNPAGDTSGTFTSSIVINDPGTIVAGNAVSVGLCSGCSTPGWAT